MGIMLNLLECHSNWLAQVVHEVLSLYGSHGALEESDRSDIQAYLTWSSFLKNGSCGKFGFEKLYSFGDIY